MNLMLRYHDTHTVLLICPLNPTTPTYPKELRGKERAKRREGARTAAGWIVARCTGQIAVITCSRLYKPLQRAQLRRVP